MYMQIEATPAEKIPQIEEKSAQAHVVTQTVTAPVAPQQASTGSTQYPPEPTGITVGNKGLFQGGVFATSPPPQAAQSSLFSNATPGKPSSLYNNVAHQPASVQIGVPLIQHTFAHIRPAPVAPVFSVNPTDAVHYGITCDKCRRNPIRGKRYKSVTRQNFDLCSNCVTKHPFCYEKFLMIPFHNPHDETVKDHNMRPVFNHFKGLGCIPTPIPFRPRHSYFHQLLQCFPADNQEEMNDFLWELHGYPYEEGQNPSHTFGATHSPWDNEVAYTSYITKYHLGC